MPEPLMIVTELEELRFARRLLDGTLGLVPTMGFLHDGHMALVRRAREECASVVVSLFVNPAQFGPNEDLAKYPRDLDRDLRLLDEAGVNLAWTPAPDVMYPPGFQTWVEVESLTRPLEGALRPGHFRGVTTVVAKLFNAVQPHKAYFGQKDAQQAAVIRRMTRDLDFPIEIVICPTVREPDGLAMSSRNTYLNPEERQAATALYRALTAARDAHASGESNAGKLRQLMTEVIQSEPLAQAQYVSCADHESLEELEQVDGPALLSLAVRIGKTRLIDNLILQKSP